MNNYINPYLLIKELYSEATTFTEKSLAILVGLWISTLGVLAATGIIAITYKLITDPAAFNNVTWGIFDTLG